MAVVVQALRSFDAELTEVAPQRTLPSWFRGDKAHQGRPSGHNPDDTPGSKAEDSDSDNVAEIRAGDFRLPLKAKFTPEQLIQFLVKECRAGRITWIKYIIYNRRIWAASSGWVQRAYGGSNPHNEHFHISCKPDSKSESFKGKVGLQKLVAKPATPKPPAKPTAPAAVPTHKNGSRQNSIDKNNVGTDVATLQRFIGASKAGKADGRFGKQTKAGVIWYQREVLGMRGKAVDGIAGPNTWRPILRELAK